MNKLTYQTQTQVSSIVRTFWGKYLGSMFVCIVLATLLFYFSGNTGIDFRRTQGIILEDSLFLAGIVVSFFGFFVFFIILQYALNMSTKQVSSEMCEHLVEWMESHPEIRQHIEQIRLERVVLVYDYGIMEVWVSAYKEEQRKARQQNACKQVHGIA